MKQHIYCRSGLSSTRDSDEGELASYTNAELGLPDSSSSDDTDDDAAGDNNEGPMV